MAYEHVKYKACPKCGKLLKPSDVEGYSWVCMGCDENFYDFEAKDVDGCPYCQSETCEEFALMSKPKAFGNLGGFDSWVYISKRLGRPTLHTYVGLVDASYTDISEAQYTEDFPINFCPVCGRDLHKEEAT